MKYWHLCDSGWMDSDEFYINDTLAVQAEPELEVSTLHINTLQLKVSTLCIRDTLGT
jgi:hypothetical protein